MKNYSYLPSTKNAFAIMNLVKETGRVLMVTRKMLATPIIEMKKYMVI